VRLLSGFKEGRRDRGDGAEAKPLGFAELQQQGQAQEGGRKGYRLREKEGYAIVIMESMIALSRESARDGLGEYYEDALENLSATVPSFEFLGRIPTPAFLSFVNHYSKEINKRQFEVDKPPINPTYLSMWLWIDALHPSEYQNLPKTDPRAGYMNRARVILKNRMLIDLLEDMGMLRHKMLLSKQEESEYVDIFAGYGDKSDDAE
jgi:hypothetical protein